MKQQQNLEKKLNLLVMGVSMLVRVPLIPHQRKQSSLTAHEEGSKKKIKGGTVVHG